MFNLFKKNTKRIKTLERACNSKEKVINNLKNQIKKTKTNLLEQLDQKNCELYRKNEEIMEIEHENGMQIIEFLTIFMDSFLNENNTGKVYNAFSELDEEGFGELAVVERLIPCNIYGEYPYEDNTGVFEFLDGYKTISYYEKAAFLGPDDVEYEFVGGMYERISNYKNYTDKKEYIEYKKNCHKLTIYEIIKREPYKSYNTFIKLFKDENKR